MNKSMVLVALIGLGIGVALHQVRNVEPFQTFFTSGSQLTQNLPAAAQGFFDWLKANPLGATLLASLSAAAITGLAKYIHNKITQAQQLDYQKQLMQMQYSMNTANNANMELAFEKERLEKRLATFPDVSSFQQQIDNLTTEKQQLQVLADQRLNDYNTLERLYASILKVPPPVEKID